MLTKLKNVFGGVLVLSLLWPACVVNNKVVPAKAETVLSTQSSLPSVLYHPIEASDVDSTLYYAFLPFIDSLSVLMSQEIAFSTIDLIKGHRDKQLDSFFVSRLYLGVSQKYPQTLKPDFSLFNTGGLRQSLYKGPILKGQLYELMPFENMPVWFWIKGSHALSMLELLASKEGQPFMFLDQSYHQPQRIQHLLQNHTLDSQRLYLVFTSDYLLAGGDNLIRKEWIDKLEYVGAETLRDLLILALKEGEGNP
jgi:hypothetical protein